jgi:ABC-type multidrug transport system fused ATPase/permease subunit
LFKLINNFFTIFNKKEKLFLFFFIFILIFFSIIDLIAIASIGPFIAVVADDNLINRNQFLFFIYNYFHFSSHENFTFFLAFFFIGAIFISSISLTINNLISIKFSSKFGEQLTNKIFYNYLNHDWSNSKNIKNSLILSQLSSDIPTIISQLLLPLLVLLGRILALLFVIIFLFTLNPLLIFTISLFISVFYTIFFIIIKKKLINNGNQISISSENRNLLVNETVVGIKEVVLFSIRKFFFDRFKFENKIIHDKTASTILLSQIPRGIIELLSIIIFVLLIILSYKFLKIDFISILPLLAIYAIAGVKIIPAVQSIFQNISLIKSSTPSFYRLYNQIINSTKNSHNNFDFEDRLNFNKFIFKNNILLEKVNYSFNDGKIALNNIDLKINKNQYIAIVGANGSGKSTLIDIILGLLHPSSGKLLIDGNLLKKEDIHSWQSNIGYVPQKFFLFTDTIYNNLIIGRKNINISKDALDKIIQITGLISFIENLPDKLETVITNNGINLSGGEKQKIVIARALIHDPEILIFDEATSALDPLSENIINNIIKELKGKKTIISITHKMLAIENCDNIFFLEHGRIKISGNYQQLLANEDFKKFSLS